LGELSENVGDNPTDIALAFKLGCELYEYFVWAEQVWRSPWEESEMLLKGGLAKSRGRIACAFDMLNDQTQLKKSDLNEHISRLNNFQERLIEAMDVQEAKAIREEIFAIDRFVHEELTPEDLPCEESDKRDKLIDQLFDEELSETLRSLFHSLHTTARQVVNGELKLLAFFRLGFEVLRPTAPLLLDKIFETEPNSLVDTHELSVLASRQILLEDARDYHSEINEIAQSGVTDGYELRYRISKVLEYPFEEFKKYGLNLILFPRTFRVGRTGYDHISLAGSPSAWSLLETVAGTANGGKKKSKRELEDDYCGREIGIKIRGDGEAVRNPIPMAKNRLNKVLVKLDLELTYSGSGYGLTDLANE